MQGKGDIVSKDIIVDLGPRMIMAGKEVLGTADNISIQVAEASEEELEKLKSAHEIRLVKMLGESGGEMPPALVSMKRLKV